MFYLRLGLALAGFAIASLYAIALAVLRRDRHRVAHDYARMLARLMHPPLGLRVEVQGRENLLARRPCVYVVNHQSALDVPVLAALYPPDTVIIGKKELTRIPLFGWLYVATGNILIDRANRGQSVGRLREAEAAIRERRVSVLIFPEGTRGKTPGELLPFKKGAFHMAVATGVPVVPVVVSPVQALFDPRRRRIRPGTVQVRVLDPIPTTHLTEAEVAPLLERIHALMAATLRQMHDSLIGRHGEGAVRPSIPRPGTSRTTPRADPYSHHP